MMKEILPTIFAITTLWLLSRSIRRRKSSKLIPNEASPSRDSAPDSGVTYSRGFDVFLNFRGPDSRHTVADILYNTLTDAGFHVFLDDEEIRKGEVIEGELLGAITNSRIYIPIFSKDYASSKWCLRELAEMVEHCQSSSGQEEKVILPIFCNVSVEDIKLRSPVYTSSLQKHKKKLGKAVVKQWEDALQKVSRIKGWHLRDHGLNKLANLIKERVLSEISANEAVFSVPDSLVGIHDRMEDIMRLLQDETPNAQFIVIHGMGGIGKTTLADVVFKNISSTFQGSCFLRDVRRSSDVVKLQEKLLSDTLCLKKPIEVSTIHDGISKISGRLSSQKVLIVLDDVDKWNYLKNLAAESHWFGPKSRIIITTRNIDFLPSKDDGKYCFYEMKEMNDDHALQLFCRHAFGNYYPLPEYHYYSKEIVSTTGRLPLALQVIGSSLYNQDKDTWEFILVKLKEAPHKDVQETLMISYQALEYEQQQIFLDIACFFNDEKTIDPVYFWEACRFYPDSVIKVLVRRSLIKENGDDKFWMHDQLRDLGRAIAQPKAQDNENQILAKSSRLWSPEVALDAVQRKEVAESIVALNLGRLDDGYFFGHDEFVKAVNLKFLQLQGGSFEGDFKNVFRKLRWLSWSDCPLKFKATNLSFTNLVVIKLSGSQITKDWTGWGAIAMAKQLKVMNLRGCTCLTKTPNFSTFLGLKRLIFINCRGLEEIDWSINKLGLLDYLEISNYDYFSNAFYDPTVRPHLLPASIGGLKSLTILELVRTGLTQLYPSIGELTLLVKLVIEELGIKELPDSIGNLRQLKILKIAGCYHVKLLPDSIGNLKMLEVIDVSYSGIKKLPKAFGELENLEELHASCSLRDGKLPEEIGRLSHLRILNLAHTKVTRTPTSLQQLPHLEKLSLCIHRSKDLPKLPSSLTDLEVTFEAPECHRLPDLSDMTNLVSLRLLDATRRSQSDGALQPYVEDTRIDWLTRLQKLEILDMDFQYLIFPPIDLSSLLRLKTLNITCFDTQSLVHLPSSLQSLKLYDVSLPIDWKFLSSLVNLSYFQLRDCRLKEITFDSLGLLHSLDFIGCRLVERLSNLSCLKELRMLQILSCHSLVGLQGLEELELLQTLVVGYCNSIKRLPDLPRSKKLRVLSFIGCKSLENIPDINEEAPCHLHVESCGSLHDFDDPCSAYHCFAPRRSGRISQGATESFSHTKVVGQWKARPHLLPASIGGLKSLTTLELVGTGLTELCPSIGELTLLVKLVICEFGIKELPYSIGNLRQLEILNITVCHVKLLPDSIGNLKRLKVLNLSYTHIKELSKALGELKNLEELHVSFCQYLDGELPEEIGRLSQLRILNLAYSTFTRMPASIQQLFHLEKLSLSIHGSKELPKLPSSSIDLEVIFRAPECHGLPNLSDMTNLVSLRLVDATRHGQFDGALQPCVVYTRIDWLTSLQKMEKLYLDLRYLIFPSMDLSSLHRLKTLGITCFNPQSLVHLPSSLQSLRLYVNWQFLSNLVNLSYFQLDHCWLEEITVDSPSPLHFLGFIDCKLVERLFNLACLKELRELNIQKCPRLVGLQGLEELELLQSLTVHNCDSIKRLPDLPRSKKLQFLAFVSCESLKSIPDINEEAPYYLMVRDCGSLHNFEGPYSRHHRTSAVGVRFPRELQG